MLKVSIIGVTGYVGYELVRLLACHSQVELVHLVTSSNAGAELEELYASLTGLNCLPALDSASVLQVAKDSDIVFTALPHGASMQVILKLYDSGVKIIDLSGDFRYDDAKVYSKWYKQEHTATHLLEQAVYGLPEMHREKIEKAMLVGNPGCYTTCSILALAPFLKSNIIQNDSIIIDAKSGSTGAGRGIKQDMHFCEVNQNVKAYGIATHRHTSEIEQELGKIAGKDIMLSFTPHLLPVNRGILATCYANLSSKVTSTQASEILQDYYKNEPFVYVCKNGKLPELKHVVGSNYCKIGVSVDERLGRLVVVSVIDNLIKGAAGQAIQNMNIMAGLDERLGLDFPAWGL